MNAKTLVRAVHAHPYVLRLSVESNRNIIDTVSKFGEEKDNSSFSYLFFRRRVR